MSDWIDEAYDRWRDKSCDEGCHECDLCATELREYLHEAHAAHCVPQVPPMGSHATLEQQRIADLRERVRELAHCVPLTPELAARIADGVERVLRARGLQGHDADMTPEFILRVSRVGGKESEIA